MKKLVLVLVLLAGAFYLHTRGNSEPQCNINGANIVVLGDSIANNYGLNASDNFGYKVASKLGKNAIIKGVNGLTTQGLKERINNDLSGISDIGAILISIGGNDVLRSILGSQSASNLKSILQSAKAKSECVVVVGVPSGAGQALMGNVASFYKEPINDARALLDDSSMPYILKERSLLIDQIHPNAAGHEIIANNILGILSN